MEKRNPSANRTQSLSEATKLLRSGELDAAYREADAESDKAWESTVADGLPDETW